MQKIASEILSARQFECGQEQHKHLCVPYLWDPDGKRYFSWGNTLQPMQLVDITALTMKLSGCRKVRLI